MREFRAHLQPLRQHFSSRRAQATYSRMPRVPGGSSMDIHSLTYWQVNVMGRRRVEEDSLLQHRLSLLCSHRAAGRGTCAASAACTQPKLLPSAKLCTTNTLDESREEFCLWNIGALAVAASVDGIFQHFPLCSLCEKNRMQKVQKFARVNTACWRLRGSFFDHYCQLVTQ